jgi:site-specific DNA-methyltransferase (adenine-specific)
MRYSRTMTEFDLRQRDCVQGMLQLADEHVDLVVTSPPYNLGIPYRTYTDGQDRQSYLEWCRKWIREICRILKSSGSLFLNVGAAPSNPLLPHQIVMELREAFVLQNTIHWIKSITIDAAAAKSYRDPRLHPLSAPPSRDPNPDAKRQGRVDGGIKTYGHFKPINSKRFLNDCHEYVFHFTKAGQVELDRLAIGVPYQDKTNIARWSHSGGSDLRCRGNTWFIPYKTIQSRAKERPHPATFPVQLAEWCIKLHGISRVETMLDPFLGIGNSAVAAQRCGVKNFIGFEIDEIYFAEARSRVIKTLSPLRCATREP